MKLRSKLETQLHRAAESIRVQLGEPAGLRILHVTDFHNRRAAFALLGALTESLAPDLVVCTGDLSGIGGPIERFLLSRWLGPFASPAVLAPGNHDSKATTDAFVRAGGAVLSGERVVDIAGIRIWGYHDPNHTRLVIGPRYDSSLCEESAREVAAAIDRIVGPFAIAVHNELMVDRVPDRCRLVLSGHFHSARIRLEGETLFVRSGTTGGRSKYSNAMRSAVIDVDPTNLSPRRVWLTEVLDDHVKVTSSTKDAG